MHCHDSIQIGPLKGCQSLSNLPALALLTYNVSYRNTDIIKKNLVVYVTSVHVVKGSHCNTRGLHVKEYKSQAFLLALNMRFSSHKCKRPVRTMCPCTPSLLTIYHIL